MDVVEIIINDNNYICKTSLVTSDIIFNHIIIQKYIEVKSVEVTKEDVRLQPWSLTLSQTWLDDSEHVTVHMTEPVASAVLYAAVCRSSRG